MGFFSFGPTNNVTFAGDLSGTDSSQTVIGLQNKPIQSETPDVGDIWKYSTTVVTTGQWRHVPETTGGVLTLGGNVTGSSDNNTVVKILNIPLQTGTVTDGDIWKYSTTVVTTGQWRHEPESAGGITLTGDVTGPPGTNLLAKIQTHPVQTGTPSEGDFWHYENNGWQHSPYPLLANNTVIPTMTDDKVINATYNPINNSVYVIGFNKTIKVDLVAKTYLILDDRMDWSANLPAHRSCYCPIDNNVYYSYYASSLYSGMRISLTDVIALFSSGNVFELMYSPSTKMIYYFTTDGVLKQYDPSTHLSVPNTSSLARTGIYRVLELTTAMSLIGTKVISQTSPTQWNCYALDGSNSYSVTMGSSADSKTYSVGPYFVIIAPLSATIPGVTIINQESGTKVNSSPLLATYHVNGISYDPRTNYLYLSLDQIDPRSDELV